MTKVAVWIRIGTRRKSPGGRVPGEMDSDLIRFLTGWISDILMGGLEYVADDMYELIGY